MRMLPSQRMLPSCECRCLPFMASEQAHAAAAQLTHCVQSLLGSGSGGITGQGVSLMAASLPSKLLLLQ